MKKLKIKKLEHSEHSDTDTESENSIKLVTKFKPSKQINFTNEEIRKKLENYHRLRSKDKATLLALPPFKIWVRYFNKTDNKFRVGGLLMKVDPDLKFITLTIPAKKLSWSVQLNDNIIYLNTLTLEKLQDKIDEKVQEEQDEYCKNKLLKLYKSGKIIIKK
jgi:hypothetical protein